MEALNFLKFWRTTTIATMPFTITEPIMVVDYISGDDEEEDSFFDLKITSDFDNKENTGHLILEANSEKNVQKYKNQKQPLILQPILSPNEFVSKRKILPVEPNSSKPQSPIALLKSAQTFRVFKFKKPNVPKFTRETSIKNRSSQKCDLSASDETSSSKRFDLMHKYLNMFKPLFDKVYSKKQNEKVKFAMDVSSASSSKMKQGNFPVGSSSPAVTRRRDDSLLQQLDGIQDAILHCKRSFNSSTDSSMDLSRKSAEEIRDVSI